MLRCEKLTGSLLEHVATPLNLVKHKEGFRDRALQDVTMNSGNPMTLDPNNPTLVREETALQKVSKLFRSLGIVRLTIRIT